MSNTDVKKLIEENYKIDVSAIRNLSGLANDLTKNGKLTVKGGLDIEGALGFLPKGSIIAWNGKEAPAGWAICNGKTVNGYKTPDLRGRFIRMSNDDIVDGDYKDFNMNAGRRDDIKGKSRAKKKTAMCQHKFGQFGGTDHQELEVREMPKHNHSMGAAGKHNHSLPPLGHAYRNTSYSLPAGGGYKMSYNGAGATFGGTSGEVGNHTHTINHNGKGWGHNVQPPYYVLTWIVRVI